MAKDNGIHLFIPIAAIWLASGTGDVQCSPYYFKVCVHIKFLLCNSLPELIWIWNNVYEICAKTFLKEHLCALQVLFCALVSRPVCVRTRAQLRGNIGDDDNDGKHLLGSRLLTFSDGAKQPTQSDRRIQPRAWLLLFGLFVNCLQIWQ